MVVLRPKRVNPLLSFFLPFTLMAILVLFFFLSSPLSVWKIVCAFILIIYMSWLAYRYFFFKKLMVADKNRLHVHSYLSVREFNNSDIDSVVIKRGGQIYHLLDLKVVKISQVTGRSKVFYFPDFEVKDFDKILLHIMRS